MSEAADTAVDAVAEASVTVQKHPVYRWLVTIGLSLYGVVHLLLAWLTVQIARGHRADASNQGSLATLASFPMGRLLIGAVAVGMAAMTVWQVIEAAFGYRWLKPPKRHVRRLASALRAIVYTTISLAGFGFLTSGKIANGNESAKDTSAQLMSLPGGSILVALVGVGVAIAAADQIQRGARRSFVKYDMSGTPPTWAVRLGIVGWVAKGVALAMVAVLFWAAALHHRAAEAGGLDQALRTFRSGPGGVVVLSLIAAGFAAFGIFCFIWAHYARHDASTD